MLLSSSPAALLFVAFAFASVAQFAFALPANVTTTAVPDITSFTECLASLRVNDVTFPSEAEFQSNWLSRVQNLKFKTIVSDPTVVRPVAIINAGDEDDIAHAIRCGSKNGIRAITKSGGHSFEGFSFMSDNDTFMIIDVSRMNHIQVDVKKKTALFEPGVTIGELLKAISDASHGKLIIPVGTCPSVGAGLFLGGGFGPLSRQFGLSADRVTGFRMVDHAGNILIAHDRANSQLYDYMKGAGGGNFGVVSLFQVSLAQVSPDQITLYKLLVPKSQAKQVLNVWQTWAPKADGRISSTVYLSGHSPFAVISGVFLGSRAEAIDVLTAGMPEVADKINEFTVFETKNLAADLLGLEPPSESGIGAFKAKSDYVSNPLPSAAWDTILSYVNKYPSLTLILDAYGGYLDTIPATATSFPHRNGTLFALQSMSQWHVASANPAEYENILNSLQNELKPYVNGMSYINWVDRSLGVNDYKSGVTYAQARVWGDRYYGVENFKHLLNLKRRYDRFDYFRGPQAIPLVREEEYY